MILGPHILSKVPLAFLLHGDDDDSNDYGDEDRDKEDEDGNEAGDDSFDGEETEMQFLVLCTHTACATSTFC